MKPQSATNPSSGTAESEITRMLPDPELRQAAAAEAQWTLAGGRHQRFVQALRAQPHPPPAVL